MLNRDKPALPTAAEVAAEVTRRIIEDPGTRSALVAAVSRDIGREIAANKIRPEDQPKSGWSLGAYEYSTERAIEAWVATHEEELRQEAQS